MKKRGKKKRKRKRKVGEKRLASAIIGRLHNEKGDVGCDAKNPADCTFAAIDKDFCGRKRRENVERRRSIESYQPVPPKLSVYNPRPFP